MLTFIQVSAPNLFMYMSSPLTLPSISLSITVYYNRRNKHREVLIIDVLNRLLAQPSVTFSGILCFCTVHCNIIIQYKTTKCTFFKLIFLIFNF